MKSAFLDRRCAPQRAAVLCAMAFLLTGTAWGAPAVGLFPDTGTPSANVIISGTGYTPGMLIDVYFDAVDKVLAVRSATGEFSIALRIPALAQPGVHWVTAAARSTGIAAQKPFLVRTNWAEIGFTAGEIAAILMKILSVV